MNVLNSTLKERSSVRSIFLLDTFNLIPTLGWQNYGTRGSFEHPSQLESPKPKRLVLWSSAGLSSAASNQRILTMSPPPNHSNSGESLRVLDPFARQDPFYSEEFNPHEEEFNDGIREITVRWENIEKENSYWSCLLPATPWFCWKSFVISCKNLSAQSWDKTRCVASFMVYFHYLEKLFFGYAREK